MGGFLRKRLRESLRRSTTFPFPWTPWPWISSVRASRRRAGRCVAGSLPKEVVAEQCAIGLEAVWWTWRVGRTSLGEARAERAGDQRVTAAFLLGSRTLKLFVYRGARLLYAHNAVGFGEEATLSETALAAYREAGPAQAERALASLYGAQPTLVIDEVVAGAGAVLPGPAFEGRLGAPAG